MIKHSTKYSAYQNFAKKHVFSMLSVKTLKKMFLFQPYSEDIIIQEPHNFFGAAIKQFFAPLAA
jgi:hypothetical protein